MRPIASFLKEFFIRHDARPLLREGCKTFTYGRVWEEAEIISNRMKQYPRGKVFLNSPNSVMWATHALASWMAGNEIVPVSSRSALSMVDKRIDQIDPVIVVGRDGHIRVRTHRETNESIASPYCATLFTSGTSGSGSAVRFTDENIMTNIRQISFATSEEMVNGDDLSYAILPWSHCYGLTCELLFLMTRGACLSIPDNNLRKTKPTLLFSVPYMLSSILDRIPWKTGSLHPVYNRVVFGGRLRSVSVGGAACSPALLKSFGEVFGVSVYQGYGMTEASPMIALSTDTRLKEGTVGCLLSGISVYVDPSTKEICVAGRNIVESLRPERYTVVGDKTFLRTGDHGVVDEDRFVHILHRTSDRVKTPSGLFIDLDMVEQVFRKVYSQSTLIVVQTDDHRLVMVSSDPRMTEMSIKELQRRGSSHGLKRHEIPSEIRVVSEETRATFFTDKFTVRRRIVLDEIGKM